MGMLSNKPSNMVAGNSVSLTMNRSAFEALLASNADFSNVANWKRVVFYFFDATGQQKVPVIFDPSVSPTVGTFKVSARAKKNTWQLYKAVVEDFDGGTVVLMRSSLGTDDDIQII